MRPNPPRSEPRQLTSIDQLTSQDILTILEKSGRLGRGEDIVRRHFSATLLILQPSLRTRLGFAEAVHRLGGIAHVITAKREIVNGSAVEDLHDVLRVASGMTDITVVRTDGILADNIGPWSGAVINAGDDLEHPTQALIDLFAIQQLCGRWQDLSLGVCGDMRMRVPRSLFKALCILPPKRLRIMCPPGRRGDAEELLTSIADRVDWEDAGDWIGLDALYMSGLPEGRGEDRMDDNQRELFALTASNIDRLPQHARVFSPMPVIDEISRPLRTDPRIVIYTQSDLGVPVRMAVLDNVLSCLPHAGS